MRAPVLIQKRSYLGRVEIDRPAGPADPAALLGELMGGREKISKIHAERTGALLTGLATFKRLGTRGLDGSHVLGCAVDGAKRDHARTGEQRLCAVVVHAHARADHARIRIVGAHTPLRIELDIDREGQAVLIGTQRAQVVRQTFGQHRQHAVGQVDRCRATPSLKVDMPVPGHVMRDVRDMDAQLIAALGRALERNGVVEIAGVDGVDRDDEAVAQVTTERVLERGVHIEREARGLVERHLRIRVGVAVTRHDVLHAQVGRVLIADTPFDGHDAGLEARGIAQDTRDHHVVLVHAQALGRRILGDDEEVRVEAAVERFDHAERAGLGVAAHDARRRALDHALDQRAAVALRTLLDADRDGVAVHDLALAAAHDLEIALVGDHVGAVLVQLHATRQARTPHAPRGAVMPAGLALTLVVTPHGASSNSNGAILPEQIVPQIDDSKGAGETDRHARPASAMIRFPPSLLEQIKKGAARKDDPEQPNPLGHLSQATRAGNDAWR